MKKIYLLAITAIAFSVTANAQFTDDMEAYNLGDMGAQSPNWSNWSGVPNNGEDIIVVDTQAQSGFQSGYIGAGAAAGGPQDAMLVLGNKTTGEWVLNFSMYVPSGKTAYFNFQGETEANGGANGGAGIFNSGNVTFNLDGAAAGEVSDIDADGTVNNTFSYPEDSWFVVSLIFSTADLQYTLSVDGVAGVPVAFGGDITIGAIDFFAIDPNNEYFVDDIDFSTLAGISDFDADSFSVYPNPVRDVLNISSKVAVDAVTIYDVLGKVVAQSEPATISPKVDMSGLSSGAYLVQVTIGDATKTIKVIK